MDARELSARERLILAGIDEIKENGVRNFSLRRTAMACGLSCAAPYKHFEDKSAFVLAIIDYINDRWHERQDIITERYAGDTRKTLTEISIEYIRFLVENPHFISIIVSDDSGMNEDQRRRKNQLSQCTMDYIEKYCVEVGMDADTQMRKTYVVRSLIYGAVLMCGNGEMPYNESMLATIRSSISREFDIE